MSFTNLIYWWSFLFVIPLAVAYLLKVKPIKKETTAFFLWAEILDQKKANQLFHKLKDLLSLLILLLAFLLICTALLNPVTVTEEDQKDLLILVDNSLSMSAIENGKSRLDLAKEKAKEMIRGMGLNRSAVLVAVSSEMQYLVDKTNNLTLLREGAESVVGSMAGLDTQLFKEMSENQSVLDHYRVILITDGCEAELAQFKFIEILKVGASVQNIGVTGFDLQRLPGKDDMAGVFLKFFNSSSETVDVEVKFSLNERDNLFKIIRVTLTPGANLPYTEIFKNMPAGKWIASISGKDSLVEDDVAYAVLPKFESVKVRIQSKDKDYFLVKCVEAFQEFKDRFIVVDENPDILLTDDQESAISSVVPAVLFGVQQSSAYWSIGDEELAAPVLLSEATEGHRVMQYIKAEALKVKGVRNIRLAKGVLPILVDENHLPVLFKVNEDHQRFVVLNFDLHQSDFFLNIHFPVLIHNICLDLTQRANAVSATYQIGDMVELPFASESVTVISPSGIKAHEVSNAYGPVVEKGFYQLSVAEKIQFIAAGTSPESESNLKNEGVQTTLRPISSGLPIAYFLMFLAIVLVLWELILYHRRKVG